jgi:hypothetical protein
MINPPSCVLCKYDNDSYAWNISFKDIWTDYRAQLHEDYSFHVAKNTFSPPQINDSGISPLETKYITVLHETVSRDFLNDTFDNTPKIQHLFATQMAALTLYIVIQTRLMHQN